MKGRKEKKMNLRRKLEIAVKFSVLFVIVIAIHHLLSLLGTGQKELQTGVTFIIPEIFKLKLFDGISRNWDVLAGIIWPVYVILLTTGKKVRPNDQSDFFAMMGIGLIAGALSTLYCKCPEILSFSILMATCIGIFSGSFCLQMGERVRAFAVGAPIMIIFKFGILPALALYAMIDGAYMIGALFGGIGKTIISPETYYRIGDFMMARKSPEEGEETPAD